MTQLNFPFPKSSYDNGWSDNSYTDLVLQMFREEDAKMKSELQTKEHFGVGAEFWIPLDNERFSVYKILSKTTQQETGLNYYQVEFLRFEEKQDAI